MRLFALLTTFCLLLGCGSQNTVTYAEPETETGTDTDNTGPAAMEADGTVELGRVAPGFELTDDNDTPQALSQLNADHYVVLVFNRGHW
ncbi:hypothetical protein OT109_06570 [Phycisphaeraceae bacterium D3-23]